MFSREQVHRYSRQIILEQVGAQGQKKLSQAKVLVIGCGGLGSPVILYLAAAGVGVLGIVDNDTVELSNLHRQIALSTQHLGQSKLKSTEESISRLNPEVKVHTYNTRADNSFLEKILPEYDLVVDGTDNFYSKYAINDCAIQKKKPVFFASLLRFEGQVFTMVPASCCYRCVFPTQPEAALIPSCAEAGVIGSVAGILGTIQASEVIKYILQQGELLTNRMLFIDVLQMNFREIHLKKISSCICNS